MTATITNADQEAHWRQFYEIAWYFRLEFVRKKIAEGEENPMRLIYLLEQQERKFVLAFDDQAKTYHWKSRDFVKKLPSRTPPVKESSFKGSRLDIPYYAKTIYTNFIIDLLQEIGDVDCIVELGCGYGRNLFEIHHHGGPSKPYFGGELTDSGGAFGDVLASFSNEQNISFHKFDHTKPDLSWLAPCKRAFIFTVHSIEQVHRIDIGFFQCLANAAQEVTGMHLEPFGFQNNPDLGDVTKIQAEQFHAKKWNVNFYQTLKQAEDRKILEIDFIDTELFLASDPLYPTSVAIWHKNNTD